MSLGRLWRRNRAFFHELEEQRSILAERAFVATRSLVSAGAIAPQPGVDSRVMRLDFSEPSDTLRHLLHDVALLREDQDRRLWAEARWLSQHLGAAYPRADGNGPWYRPLPPEVRQRARESRTALSRVPAKDRVKRLLRFRDTELVEAPPSRGAGTDPAGELVPTLLDTFSRTGLGDAGLFVSKVQVEQLLDGVIGARAKLAAREEVLLLRDQAIAHVDRHREARQVDLESALVIALGVGPEEARSDSGYQQCVLELRARLASAALSEFVPSHSSELEQLARSATRVLHMLSVGQATLDSFERLLSLADNIIGGRRAAILFVTDESAVESLREVQASIMDGLSRVSAAAAIPALSAVARSAAPLSVLGMLTGLNGQAHLTRTADGPTGTQKLDVVARALTAFEGRRSQLISAWHRVHAASAAWTTVAGTLQFLPVRGSASEVLLQADRAVRELQLMPSGGAEAARDYLDMVQQLTTEWAGVPSPVAEIVGAMPAGSRPYSVLTRLQEVVADRRWSSLTSWGTLSMRTTATERALSPSAQQSALDYLAGLVPHRSSRLISASGLDELRALWRATTHISEGERSQTTAILLAFDKVQENRARQELRAFPIEKLRDTTQGRLNLQPLTRAGFTTVADICNTTVARMEAIPGVGYQTAAHVKGAADRLRQASREDLGIRIDLDPKNRDVTHLLELIRTYLAVNDYGRKRGEVEAWIARYKALLNLPAGDLLLRIPADSQLQAIEPFPHAELVKTLGEQILRGGPQSSSAKGATRTTSDVWDHFQQESPAYYEVLSRLTGIPIDIEAEQGHLPTEIANAVRQFQLNRDLLTVSLREYQVFGAKYALVQRRSLIGDEMGLGKTIQALAVTAHLAAAGKKSFVVICPVSVLYNWMRETRQRTKLTPHILHGPERADSVRRWQRQGGVAITSFGYARHLSELDTPIDALIVDEAHFVKSPRTQRTQAVRELAERADRVLFMTGTPLENRLTEFTEVTRPLNPAIAKELDRSAETMTPKRFRESVSPVYLRRNAKDVLTELPDVVEVMEEVELSKDDHHSYLGALSRRDFHGMRRAAFEGHDSAKMQRLVQLVHESAANDRKVVVFTYFLDVAARVARELGKHSHGPITGQTPAAARQGIIDTFAAAKGPAVLVSQIVAGGTGLNIQAASVVIICEPQLKPTLETQAIGRVHRMGQLRSVQVHRLIALDTVDGRILQILAGKRKIFDDYARHSAMVDAAPESIDVSEKQLADLVIAQERDRHLKELQRVLGGPKAPEPQLEAQSSASAPEPPLVAQSVVPDGDDDEAPNLEYEMLAEVARRGTTPEALRLFATKSVLPATPQRVASNAGDEDGPDAVVDVDLELLASPVFSDREGEVAVLAPRSLGGLMEHRLVGYLYARDRASVIHLLPDNGSSPVPCRGRVCLHELGVERRTPWVPTTGRPLNPEEEKSLGFQVGQIFVDLASVGRRS